MSEAHNAKQFQRTLVTSALPYANGKIHLGHLAGAYLTADIYVRYLRSMKPDVLFVCGSDEHGVPITITAEQEKTTPQAVVDRYHALNKAAFERFGMSFDHYSRTSLPLHHETAGEFFLAMHDAGILKEKNERQLYDEQAKMFLPDRYVEGTCPKCGNPDARGDQCERCGTFLSPLDLVNPKSKITGNTPAVRETTHWYFPLGAYQSKLEAYIRDADRRDGWKENVLQYCRSWFREGLQDRAVTRDLRWGVKVPLKGFEDKVLYVWFDAVLGYISGSKAWANERGTPDAWKKYWNDPGTKYVAFIGKDNVVFHCIVFPAMLMAWNEHHPGQRYILPENVPANEFLNFESQKFSKSRGWGIDVDDFLAEFPPDTLRYTLCMNLPEQRDADFTWKEFQARTNNELADIFGNFVNRTLTFLQKNFDGTVPAPGEPSPPDLELGSVLASVPGAAGALVESYRFRDALIEVMKLARASNKYFNDCEPWKTLKQDPKRCGTTLYWCLQAVRSLAILTEPFLPFSAQRIWSMLRCDGTPLSAGWVSAGAAGLVPGHRIGTPELLFAKIEDEAIMKHVPGEATAPVPPPPAPRQTIGIDAFKQVELRVATVLAAERIPKSEKLLKLQVSIGAERRQIVAGIALAYPPEALVGKKVIVVANLAPAKLLGQTSEGMILAASDDQGNLTVIVPGTDIADGSIVK